MNEDKKNLPSFNPEKSGDSEKYKTIIGVRDESGEAEHANTNDLRAKMREAMISTTIPTSKPLPDQLAEALSNPSSKAIRYGVIGSGHGGSRIAEQFYQFGYKTCVLNTAQQDLHHINLPGENKLLVGSTFGGAGKSLDLGEASARESEEEIKSLLSRTFGENVSDVDAFFLCISGGGGSGSGSSIPLIEMLSDYGLPITLIYTLPMSNEGTITKHNAIVTLDKLAKLSVHNLINGLIVVDNSRIADLYKDVSLGGFYKVANFDIVDILNRFNTLSSLPSTYVALDPTDYIRIMSSGGCTIFGKVEIDLNLDQGSIQLSEDDLAEQITKSLESGLLAEGFDLSQAIRCGVYILGNPTHLNQVSAETFNFCFASLNELFGKADIFRGVYPDNQLKDKFVAYVLVSGVGLPRLRVEQLMEQAQADVEEMESKEQEMRSKMEVFQQTVSNKEQDRYKQKKKDNTTFNKMLNRRRER